ncbi:MAG: class II aldolase/adducin family protein [Streptosporangiaceae bacterium]
MSSDLREIVARSAHDLSQRRLSWGRDAGDTSARDPVTGEIYILPKPAPGLLIPTWDVIEPQHVALVDADGEVRGDGRVQPTVELLTHLRIYQNRPDVHAVVHTHGRWSRVFAALRKPIPPLMIDSFIYTGASPILCSEYGGIGTDEVAYSAVSCLGKHGKSALLANHGAVCVGADMDEAMSVAEITEDMARLALYASALGEPFELTLADLEDPDETRTRLLARYEV